MKTIAVLHLYAGFIYCIVLLFCNNNVLIYLLMHTFLLMVIKVINILFDQEYQYVVMEIYLGQAVHQAGAFTANITMCEFVHICVIYICISQDATA